MFEWADDLKLKGCDLYLDSRQPRRASFVSHAHSDHIAIHQKAIATSATAALSEHRIGSQNMACVEYGESLDFDCDTRLTLLPAGHVVGSAMLHVTRPEGTLLYTGDFKLRESLTVRQAEPVKSDVLVMESTFGRPFFRFPDWKLVAEQLVQIVGEALRSGRQPIVMGYTLGKAQEAIKILTAAGFAVTLHGAVHSVARIHEKLGIQLGPFRRYAYEDFHGPRALDLMVRGVLIAPPSAARTGFVTRFKDPCRIVLTGWAMLKGAQFRYGVDHALPLSDHADFDELLELVERVSPRKIYTHHGYKEFAETLREMGHDAEVARPDPQLLLF